MIINQAATTKKNNIRIKTTQQGHSSSLRCKVVQHLIVFWHLQIGYSHSISPILLINPSQIITHKYNSSILIQPFFQLLFLGIASFADGDQEKQLSVFYDFTTQCVTTNNLFVFVLCISWFLFNFILFNCAPIVLHGVGPFFFSFSLFLFVLFLNINRFFWCNTKYFNCFCIY